MPPSLSQQASQFCQSDPLSEEKSHTGCWHFPLSEEINHLSNKYLKLILVLFSMIIMDRNKVWKDELTLWADARQKSPGLVRPYNNLGEAHDKLGNYDQAIGEFQEALKINPKYLSQNKFNSIF